MPGRSSRTTGHSRQLRDAVRALLVAHGTFDVTRRPCGTPMAAPHAWALLVLRARGPLSVGELAQRLNIDRTNVSRLCTRMESAGEIRRRPDPADRRAKTIDLTEKGRRVAEQVDQASIQHFALLVENLGSRQSETVTESLKTLARAMSR
ncbi:MAG: MarR family winged helix-turn-helix transcriptional regulator [Myxococcota bacterium]